MPWSRPNFPSIQLGSLKAYTDQVFDGNVETLTYSAFFEILSRAGRGDHFSVFEKFEGLREISYFLLFLTRFGRCLDIDSKLPSLPRLLSPVKSYSRSVNPVSLVQLKRLERATSDFIDEELAPNLLSTSINLVGFTLSYNQVYASLYCAYYLKEVLKRKNITFIFGGMSAALPETMNLFRRLGLPCYSIVGEGEGKLTAINRALLGLAVDSDIADAVPRLDIDGVIDPQTFTRRDLSSPNNYESQLDSLRDLPLPDYDEYFERLEGMERRLKKPHALRADAGIFFEGSRGCFGSYDFCGLNVLWKGFRKRGVAEIVNGTVTLLKRYRVPYLHFVDSVCDAWAESYSKELIAMGVRTPTYMELRAHHPETFWTKLALAGVVRIQVGVEALAPQLLKQMNKGTRVIQNLACHKFLKELRIETGANLITYHPQSTLGDVRETRRILCFIGHLDPFTLSTYSLAFGSPLFNRLSSEEQSSLAPFHEIPVSRDFDSLLPGFWLTSPRSLQLSKKLRASWREFEEWYLAEVRSYCDEKTLTVEKLSSDYLMIRDQRLKNRDVYAIEGEAALLYGLCHHGSRVETLIRAHPIGEPRLLRILGDFISRRIMVVVDGYYLSLALRPRDELIANYLREKEGSSREPSRRVVEGCSSVGSD